MEMEYQFFKWNAKKHCYQEMKGLSLESMTIQDKPHIKLTQVFLTEVK